MEKNDLQTHGSAMGKKMAVAFSVLQQGRDRNPQSKRTKTARLETLYRGHILALDYKQTE